MRNREVVDVDDPREPAEAVEEDAQLVVGAIETDPYRPLEIEPAILELSGGGLATFTGGYWLPRWAGESSWSLRGSERWVNWQPAQSRLEIHGPQPQWYATEELFEYTVDDIVGYGGRPGLELVRDWVAAAREERRVCRNTPETHLATFELLDAIYLSSREGRRVECEISPRDG